MTSQLPPAHRLARGIGALALLALLLIGTPLALWLLVGWPLPSTVPSLDTLGDSLTRSSISDDTLLKAIAIVGWLAWLQIVASIVLEATARLGNRPARDHRSLPIQPFVRGLITSVALLIASTRMPTATAQAARPIVATAPAEPTRISQPVSAPTATPVAGTSLPTYTVERHDTLWGIAEAHLADPFRWREIADLNLGQPQPIGGALNDPNIIQPGWVLALPADATSLAPTAATPAEPATANREPGPPPVPDAVADGQNHSEQVDPSVTPPPADALPAPASPPSSTLTPSTSTAESGEPIADQATATVPAPLIASALTAASIVTFLELLRRARQRRRRPGQSPRRPTKTNELTEFRLRTAGRLDRAELLSVAVRAFAGGAKPARSSSPTVQAVRSNDREVEILLDQPLPEAPPGFIDAGSGRAWRTDPTQHELLEYVADLDDVIAPLPSLVSVGSLNGDEILIDIETVGLITITGDEKQAIGLVRAIASQLSTSIWIDYARVLTVGDLSFELDPEMRVQHSSSFDAAITTLKRETEDADRALGFVHRKNSFESRLAKAANDGWMPTILVSETTPTREQVEQLATVCTPGGRCAGAVVLSEPIDGAWSLTIEGNRVHVDPLGFDLDIATITTEAAAAIDELLTDLKVDDDVSEIAEPACAPVGATAPVAPESTTVAELEVNVIGPVEIPGYDEKLDRNIYAELVTYLALHPEGATDERLKTVLWPDSSPKGNSFNTTVSTTRGRLGEASDGSLHLLRFLDAGQRYRLGKYVTTDLARIEQASRRASDLPASDAIPLLHEALELVRGQPFEAPRSYPWAFSEGWVTAIEATVAEAAHQLATLCLDAHDPAGATWAARQGLKACPGDEQLYRDRMLAADQTGNPAVVEAIMRELCEFAEVLEPYADVHPETFALYQRLVPRRTRPPHR